MAIEPHDDNPTEDVEVAPVYDEQGQAEEDDWTSGAEDDCEYDSGQYADDYEDHDDYEADDEETVCRPLPDYAQVDPALARGAGAWLDDYVGYAMAKSPMTPRLFHESAGLWLVSTAIARRLVLRMDFDDVYPNLFVAWIAPTTRYRKTTALGVARSLAYRVFPHLLAAQDTTPEALLSDMAGRDSGNGRQMTADELARWQAARDFAAQRGILRDEMSGLLASAGRDYMAGLVEAFLSFYDCIPLFTRSTRQQGRIEVRNASLTFLGASTPAALGPHFRAERLWANGWWPRVALLGPNGRPEWRKAAQMDEPPSLAGKLGELMDRLPEAHWPDPAEEVVVTLGNGVLAAWERYSRAVSHDLLTDDLDSRLHGTYGRLPTQLLKVGTILAALDWGEGDPRIELRHLARAIGIVETWRESAHRVLEQSQGSEYQGLRDRIIQLLGVRDLSLRDFTKAMRQVKPRILEDTLEQMVRAGDIETYVSEPGPKGGRPTMRYRLVTE